MYKKISIAILSIIFIFVLAPAVFASTITTDERTMTSGVVNLHNFSNQVFFINAIIIKPISGGDWQEFGTNCIIGNYCTFPHDNLETGDFSWDFAGDVTGTGIFYLVGDYIGGGGSASNDLTTIMGAIITSSVDLTTSVFTTYWPYVLVIGIIGALIVVFVRLFKVFR